MTAPDAVDRAPTGADSPRSGTAADSLATLDDPETFEAVVADAGGPGLLAVVGAPFSGREAVLEAASARLGATRIQLGPEANVGTIRTKLGDGPVVVEGCHHLHARRIGGFEPVERFLRMLAGVDTTVVTGWNRHAWSYLSAVVDVDREFSARVEVEPATATELADRLLNRYARDERRPTFVRDAPDTGGVLTIRRVPVEWRTHTVSLPVPVLSRSLWSGRAGRTNLDPTEAVFERLAAVSNGNRGVAAAIWERREQEGENENDEIRPSDLTAAGADADFTREDAFCLRLVLSKEVVDREELLATFGERTDRVLGRLTRAGVVSVESGRVSLDPTGVPTAVAETDRWGIP